jgi:hypothetical protein
MKMSYRMLPKRQRAALTEIPGASMKSENQTQDPAGDDKEQAGNEFFGGNTEHGTEVESLAQPWTTLSENQESAPRPNTGGRTWCGQWKIPAARDRKSGGKIKDWRQTKMSRGTTSWMWVTPINRAEKNKNEGELTGCWAVNSKKNGSLVKENQSTTIDQIWPAEANPSSGKTNWLQHEFSGGQKPVCRKSDRGQNAWPAAAWSTDPGQNDSMSSQMLQKNET